ncbi:hypothetical protein VA599_01580 [Chromobacterium sp. TRC.1.1.SA]|uniref:GH18 domain-containing protein n=1 Tax=Chromobacterium indicum TaxID=3110228 RepID=A0ABV0CHH1_9NEIS
MDQEIKAVYLKASPKSDIDQLCDSEFNTVIATFVSFANGQACVDGPMADWQPDGWIDRLHCSNKKVLFSIGGGAVLPETLEFLFLSPESTEICQAGYAPFLSAIRQILQGGPITVYSLSGAPYPTDYGQGFHGIDLDLENFASYSGGVQSDFWATRLANLNLALRRDLPLGTLLTHAPQTPYLLIGDWGVGEVSANPNGLYSKMMQLSGEAVSWLNVQIYNQSDFASPQAVENTLAVLLNDWPMVAGASTSARQVAVTVAMAPPPVECSSGYVSPAQLRDALSALNVAPGGLNGWSYSSNNAVAPSWDQVFTQILNAKQASGRP